MLTSQYLGYNQFYDCLPQFRNMSTKFLIEKYGMFHFFNKGLHFVYPFARSIIASLNQLFEKELESEHYLAIGYPLLHMSDWTTRGEEIKNYNETIFHI